MYVYRDLRIIFHSEIHIVHILRVKEKINHLGFKVPKSLRSITLNSLHYKVCKTIVIIMGIIKSWTECTLDFQRESLYFKIFLFLMKLV